MKKKYNLFSESFVELILIFICMILIKSYNANEISESFPNIEISNSGNEYTGHTLVVDEKCLNLDMNIWTVCPKGPYSWNIEAGLDPSFENNEVDGNYMRLYASKADNMHGFMTAAIKTKKPYGDGIFECEARFKGGNASWPAIWMAPAHVKPDYENYYEIDLSEYYELRDNTDVTLHVPESMKDSSRHCFTTKKVDINKNDWNKFKCKWDEKSIIVYVNDKEALRLDNNGNPDQYPLKAFQREFFIILSMQIQFDSKYLKPFDISQLPLWMDVRNIKYWKKN